MANSVDRVTEHVQKIRVMHAFPAPRVVGLVLWLLLSLHFPVGAMAASFAQTEWSGGTPASWSFTSAGNYSFNTSDIEITGGAARLVGTVDAFAYRKPITITNSGSALTDYQIQVTVDTASLISAGKMNSDGSDIRFRDSDGVTELDYWIERGINTASTTIWVKVPSIPNPSKTIWLYYGNPSAAAASDTVAMEYVGDGTNHSAQSGVDAFTPTIGMWNGGEYIKWSLSLGSGDYDVLIRHANTNACTASLNESWTFDSTGKTLTLHSNWETSSFTFNSVGSGTHTIRINFNNMGSYNAGVCDDNLFMKWVAVKKHAATAPSVSVGTEESSVTYPATNPILVNATGQSFLALSGFTETLGAGNEGSVKYQISNDGTNWYYHDGASWVAASGFSQTNTAAEVDGNISSFVSDVGTGTFYFHAFLSSNGSQQVALDRINLTYTDCADGTWTGTECIATSSANQGDWTAYTSADGNLAPINAGADLAVAATQGSTTHTSDADFSLDTPSIAHTTDADFSGTVSGAVVSGGSVQLDSTINIDAGTGTDGVFDSSTYDGSSIPGITGTAPSISIDTDETTHSGIYNFTSFTLAAGDTITVTGSNPLIIKASGNVDINGTLNGDGANGSDSGSGTAGGGGPGGGAGGGSCQPGTSGDGSGAPGNGGGRGETSGQHDGAGGGGYGTAGSSGGTGYEGTPGAGGGTYGDAAITNLYGGSGGGGAATMSSGCIGAKGGGGGGAIQINSAGTITVAGLITVNGGQGGKGNGCGSCSAMGGSGGSGSGGAIKLVADAVDLSGSGTRLSAVGGAATPKTGYYDGAGGAGGNGRIRLEDNDATVGGSGSANPTPSVANISTQVFDTSGTYTSPIIDTGDTPSWGTVNWTEGGTGTLTVKIRTCDDTLCSGESAFSGLTTVTNGQDISTVTGVTDGDQYVQYEVTLSTADASVTPTFNDITINYAPAVGASGTDVEVANNSVALSVTEISSSESGLVALYHMNNDWTDATGNGNTGTPSGSQFTTSAKVGSHAGLFGSTDTVDVSETNIPSGASGENLTVEFWINPDDVSGVPLVLSITDEWTVRLENGGEVWIRTWGSNNGGTTQTIPAGKWSHVAVTWDVGNSFAVYVNGQAWTSNTTSTTDTSADSGNNLVIGGNGFIGRLDEVAIYNRLLAPSEIAAHYVGSYNTPGTYTSASINLGNDYALTTLDYTTSTPPNTAVNIDVRAGNTAAPDGAWTSWLTGVASGGDISALGRKQYMQYRATLSTTDTSATPSLDDITFNYNTYATGSYDLISSTFDTEDDFNKIDSLIWSADTSGTGTGVKFQLRTSVDGTTWGSWYGPTSTSDYYTTSGTAINATNADGDDRYFQYKATLTAVDDAYTPLLQDVTISYKTYLPTVTLDATDATAFEQESDMAAFTVARTGGDINTDLVVHYSIAGTATNGTDYSALSGSVTIPSGSNSTTLTVTPLDDALVEGIEDVVLTMNADSAYIIGSPDSATVTIASDDAAGIVVTPTGSLSTTEAGVSASFSVVLTSQPTAEVSVGITSSDPSEGTVGPAGLVFTSADWNVPHTVTVTGTDDAIDDGDIDYSVVTGPAASADPNYDGLAVSDVTVTNADDDTAGISIAPASGLTTTETGGTDSFTVVLDAQPGADVTLNLSSSDTSEGTVSPSALTFSAANWNTPQTVTVTGVDDDTADGDTAYTILTAAAASSDGNYNGLNPTDVAVSNGDNDTAGISIAPASGLTTTEAGGTDSFSVVLDAQPGADVTLNLSSSDTSEGTVSPSALTFSAANWNTPQTVTVTGVDDDIADGDTAYTILTAAAASSDGIYNGLNPTDVAVSNGDNDTAGISIAPASGLTTTEAGGTDSFTVVLDAQPGADVTLNLSSSDTSEGTVSPSALTFSAANWNTPQTVTVTGVNDDIDDGDIEYTIITKTVTSSDPDYNNLNPDDISVTNTQGDHPVVNFALNQTVTEGTTVTVAAHLSAPASSYPVVIPYTVTGTAVNPDDHDASNGEITISSGTEGTIIFDTVDDSVSEGDETVVFTLGESTDLRIGLHDAHTVTVTEGNVAPTVTLTSRQDATMTQLITLDKGTVTVTAQVDDINEQDNHEFDWSQTDNALVDLDDTASTLVFNPATLNAGYYRVEVTVTDSGNPPLATKVDRLLRVIKRAPALSQNDTDGDTVSDTSEGIGDADNDGISDYRDADRLDESTLQSLPLRSKKYLLKTLPGLRLRIGHTAFATERGAAKVLSSEIAAYGNGDGTGGLNGYDTIDNVGGYFDFEVSALPQAGQTVEVVIPQLKPIPANAVYRKYTPAFGWQDFVIDENNRLASAPGAPGKCPPAGDPVYTAGLTTGHYCVQISLEDGGPNDADGVANHIAKDPGGIGTHGGGIFGLMSLGWLLTCFLIVHKRNGKICKPR